MTRARKVDLIALETLLHSGHSMSEVARRMQVNKGTISRAAARLRATSKEIRLPDAGGVGSSILNSERLTKIMTAVENQLAGIQKAIDESSGEEKRRWLKIQVEHSREIRQQLALLKEISIALHGAGEIEAFRQIVLQTIGECSEETRAKILGRLRARRDASNLVG